jgi:transcriptional regulator with XRE-family HTH domain
MSHRKLKNYLRTYRRRAGFSQKEVAFLLGAASKGKVSRYEHYIRQPRLQTVFVYELILGATARELFAGIFQEIERTTINRAVLLASKLKQAHPKRMTARKLELLRAIIAASHKNRIPYD